MASESGWSGFFGFIDILKGLPTVPKIIMFLGIVIFLSGVFVGPFSIIHNPRLSSGVALLFSSLGWRDFARVPSRVSDGYHRSPPNYAKFFSGLLWYAISAGMFYVAYRAS
jgi:hypothetical protein